MLTSFLFKRIDNAPLIVFRIIFGLLIFLESVGAIFTGWIKITLIRPEFTFNFIGLDWLQPLPGHWMYVYYAVMGIFGLFVMIGFKYRWSMAAFTLMWTATYLMQKASYNNHYYLLILICLLMLVLPANRYLSVDALRNKGMRDISMPRWCSVIIILQVGIVYTYAAIAKLYPDWLNYTVVENLMLGRKNYPVVGELFQKHGVHVFITWAGILFDGLVVPLLLWKPTRKIAFAASVVFHLFNSFVFQIGIFPYMSLAFTLFFFEPRVIRNIFLKRKPLYTGNEVVVPANKNIILLAGMIYFIVQTGLPLRHWFIEGDVLWTEEAHRMSWRMMLRSKSGYMRFKVVDKASGKKEMIYPKDRLSLKQQRIVATKPDVIWQFAQRLKKEYAAKGKDVAVYAIGRVSVNRKRPRTFIDPKVDLASEKWDPFRHSSWILPED
ncbi:HTTM domain-containing protein [Sinomicrobium weinanense]|uniref:HTTM domain-containing protein n=1 Tax=Sinomicrobium weinanense TaxID=2842200 RepID=A0A926Q466_9FLAO|nr:HTTM domain-containing protein [Sinomicrobium weinanense]MBC9796751.1 HTTM domain-containing protein [Sinomicrobium weinanense]MBU3124022.1 HTTM domain-containing protein [Sinomicrobium weinanense]